MFPVATGFFFGFFYQSNRCSTVNHTVPDRKHKSRLELGQLQLVCYDGACYLKWKMFLLHCHWYLLPLTSCQYCLLNTSGNRSEHRNSVNAIIM